MSVLVDNPIDITIGAAWCAMVTKEFGPAIYETLDEIEEQLKTIGVPLSEGQHARTHNCYVAIGKRRANGTRVLDLRVQIAMTEPGTWANYEIIALEICGSKYCFRHYTSHKPQIKNDFSSRSFTTIYKVPKEVFESLKEQING